MTPHLISSSITSARRHAGFLAGNLREAADHAPDFLRKNTRQVICRYQDMGPLNKGRLQGTASAALASALLFVAFRNETPACPETRLSEKPPASVLVAAAGKEVGTEPVPAKQHARSRAADTGEEMAEALELMERQQEKEIAIHVEQAKREQAAAMEQAHLYQLHQLQMREQAELNHQEAVRRAYQEAESRIRHYEQDAAGTMGSIQGY